MIRAKETYRNHRQNVRLYTEKSIEALFVFILFIFLNKKREGDKSRYNYILQAPNLPGKKEALLKRTRSG